MIPATFDYVRPSTIDEAVDALAELGDEAKVLAGGHSLLPMMRLRLAAPETVIDIGRIEALRGIDVFTDRGGNDTIVIGALTTHAEVAASELLQARCPILPAVAAQIGDPQVRHRGTIGGGIAHGDAAGDLPAALLAAGGSVRVKGPEGTRDIPADELFSDYLETAIADDEILLEVRVPAMDGWSAHYEKMVRVAQAWAIVGSAAMVRRDNGSIAEARVGLTHMGTTPVRATATEEALRGASLDAIPSAAQHAADGTSPPSDLNASADFRRHLARVLTRRALVEAAGS